MGGIVDCATRPTKLFPELRSESLLTGRLQFGVLWSAADGVDFERR
ncbi:hypothetical protein PC116_g12797 [Phytophthora cactorum]|uniref:Uncharacterized protein n=1 Tax=Phytophthora cactorum TaxID=29920 RepID=A0A8T1BYI5_9STRA|nr:hypothetical protein Pcac1_g6945 [Phytophthora cactorum]KAG2886551.1 hypothetical protein PC114_g19207 [Phytophthora cactorum]KAG2912910.1 hypothetical protein PC117_g18758 [Phytophthora cactorum]KAG2990839.1 hypothetical protein PC119_g19046 [Phytophthora cactorum]KAG3141971.1 hypothetical protein C6341_g19553 [Phytophthora cactorum]